MPAIRAVFILRLRRVPDMPARTWYGEIEHVPTAQVARFAELPQLFAHLKELLDAIEIEGSAPQDRNSG